MKDKFWESPPPVNCDVCYALIPGVFIDGRTRMGPWACMCETCHAEVGCGLGVGNGQKYVEQTDGRFKKEID